jgi:hypothetical protein
MPTDGTVSGEIRHFIKDRGWPQKRAVAAALNMKRSGKIRKNPSRAGRRAGRRK